MLKSMRFIGTIAIGIAASFLVPRAQAQTAQITGAVVDPTGAVIPDASVQIKETETGIVRSVLTNATGYYVAPSLPRGNYEIDVRKTGFESVLRSNITLDEAQVLRLDFRMALGSATQTVHVTEAPPVLDTVTSSLSSVIASNKILQLPVMNRNLSQLTTLVPGVVPVSTNFAGLAVASSAFALDSISGGERGANSFLIDNVAADNVATGGVSDLLSIDDVAEFRVITRNAPAEYGREGGGIVLMTSQSGTNSFHGSAYEYLRTTDMNANDFFSNLAGLPRANSNLNQWGGTIGGPVVRNKTFFFFNYEGFKLNAAQNVTRTVPTVAQRSGNFSGTTDSRGNQVIIYDPLSTTRSGAGYTRTQFANNLIPPGRLSPVAQAILQYIPLPNQPGVGTTGANNYFSQGSFPETEWVYGLKIDQNFNDAQRLSVRSTVDSGVDDSEPDYFGTAAEPQTENTLSHYNTAVNYTFAIKPTLLLEAYAGMTLQEIDEHVRGQGFDLSSLGLPAGLQTQLGAKLFPEVGIKGVTTVGGTAAPFVQGNYSYTVGAALTQTRDTHTLKLGGEYRVYQLNNTQPTGVPLNLQFDTGFTQGPNPNTSGTNIGSATASFLLGYPGASTQGNIFGTATNTLKYGALFMQDDWKITRKLTLNPGLRWDFEGPYTDRFNEMSNFNPTVGFTVDGIPLVGQLFYPGIKGVPRGNRNPSWVHFAPRLGVAYQLFNRTVIRAAYGLFYPPSTAVVVTIPRSGFDQTTNIVNTNASIEGGFYPTVTLSNPFPSGLIPPPGNSGGPTSGVGTSISATLRSMDTGYSQQISVDIQRELPEEIKLDVGYMGNMGADLPASQVLDYLPFPVRQQYTVAQLQAAVPYPYCPIVPTGLVCNSTTAESNLLTTYPQFTGVTVLSNWAHSTYHALTISVQRRSSQGIDITSSYTFSKMIDDNTNEGSRGGQGPAQDWGNLRAEKSVSENNLPQRFVTSVLYPLPFFRNNSRLVRSFLGGWEATAILTLQSGSSIGVTTASGNPPFAGSRPNLIGNPKPAHQTYTQWLDPAAFSVAAAETPGDAPRNLSSIRTQRYFDLDASLLKDIPITERWQLHIAAQASNATNTPTFGAPNTGFGSNSFGVITSDYSSPRNLQLSARVTF